MANAANADRQCNPAASRELRANLSLQTAIDSDRSQALVSLANNKAEALQAEDAAK
ncbi:MAG TPA: hypothetical protein PKC13_12615 [Blastocatellia bacterium]|nr:hypothetical protein [Blastocatellia bacterium]